MLFLSLRFRRHRGDHMVLPYVRAITLTSDRGLYRSWLKDGIITDEMKRMRQVCRRLACPSDPSDRRLLER